MPNPDPLNRPATESTSERALADEAEAKSGVGVTRLPVQNQRDSTLQIAAAAGLTGVVAWLLWKLRLRRRPSTPTERVTEATHKLGTASAELGSRALDRLGDVAEPVADAALAAGHKVGSTLSEVPDVVSDGVESVQKWWSKWTRRLVIAVFGGTGYVLGAAAGRERYEQIAGAARAVAGRVGSAAP